MNQKSNLDIESMEGRSYIIGREGHIHIDSPIASKYHAELRIIGRRIYLRDLIRPMVLFW
ncbi:MAG TPA: FHA domain-containing protein [Gammaproteobacteria bacterium]|nr:FHA domain-containing protein [Gammaproteobacteria bacterium]